MRKPLLILVFTLVASVLQQAVAQIPDDTDGRLYRLCKTWGYFKYFSQHKCELEWDTLLYTTVNQVLAADDNEEFNDALMAMFNKVGNNSYLDNQYPQPDTNLNFDNSWIDDPVFSDPVQEFLEIFTSYIYPDTSTCLVKFNDGSVPGYYSYIFFNNDVPTMPVDLYDEAYRLTYIFTYWNIINYFFPYRNLMDQPWDTTLLQFIPDFRQVTTIPEFHVTFLRLVTNINDSHGFTSSSVLTSFFWGGTYMPKIYLRRVGANCVVAKVEGIAGVNTGDILTALKGIPIDVVEDSLANYIPASTPAGLYRDMYTNMIKGTMNSTFEMTFTDAGNNTYTTTATRSSSLTGWYNWAFEYENPDPYYLTSCDYGYVNMGLLMPDDVPAMYEALKNAPAIIFDIRNYPNGTLWDVGPLLFPAPIISAVYYNPALTYLYNPVEYYYPGWYYELNDQFNLGNWFNPEAYDGNVYILVNEETQSQAEYTCQYFSFHPNGKVFGTQTAGADGNVSYLNLPGGITSYFTSLGWYYGDGYQQQRNGVRIDTIVSPTIEGIRQGKDEILLAALDCLTGVNEPLRAEGIGLRVYPNPAGEQLTVARLGNKLSIVDCRLSIVDLNGRIVKDIPDLVLPCTVDISGLADGIYMLKVYSGKNNLENLKFVISSNR